MRSEDITSKDEHICCLFGQIKVAKLQMEI
jgi:hypothetical protein